MNQKLIDAENKLRRAGTSSGATVAPATIEEMSQKLMDAESSIKVLRRIKNAYQQTSEVRCKGCSKLF